MPIKFKKDHEGKSLYKKPIIEKKQPNANEESKSKIQVDFAKIDFISTINNVDKRQCRSCCVFNKSNNIKNSSSEGKSIIMIKLNKKNRKIISKYNEDNDTELLNDYKKCYKDKKGTRMMKFNFNYGKVK